MSTSMGHRARPSVFGTAAQAWRSAWLAMLRMPLLMLATVLVRLVCSTCEEALTGAGTSRNPYRVVLLVLLGFVPVVLLAPLAIAVHRFVLLGERTRLWPRVRIQVVLQFAGWLVTWSAVDSLAALLKQLPYQGMTLIAGSVQIALFVLYIRLVLMLPAIALQSPQQPAALSWRQTRRRFWRISAVLFVVEAPLIVPFLSAVMKLLWVWHGVIPHHLQVMMITLGAPLGVAIAVLGAATLSWLFRRYDVADEPTDLSPAAT